MSESGGPPQDDAAGLVAAGAGRAENASTGATRAALANAMVGMKAKYYGKGPTRAKAYIEDQHVFVVMDGGLTAAEEVMLADGKEEQVRDFRLSFEASMRDTTMRAVAEIVGCDVLDYHSQIVFDPPRTLEWFVLASAPAD
ncbi:MAG TPA: Na-translocating system protein MpsC family protein [Solirubrobacteraceae bacterium]